MIRKSLSISLMTLLLSGCLTSYEEEYKAAQARILELEKQLTEAQRKLKAADNEARHQIFTLSRRANSFLQSGSLNVAEIKRLKQEITVHLDSYAQLNGSEDQAALVGRFYTRNLDSIINLHRDAARAFDRQYNSCLSDLDSKGRKTDLSTMLCEVQADVARKDPNEKLIASVTALLEVGKKLLDQERQNSASVEPFDSVQQRYQSRLTELLNQSAS